MCDYRSETTNFTWDRALVLGRGTVGCVFYGMRKGTSEAVAVKCFTGIGHDRSMHLKLREIDVMRKLNHENIVKVLAVEDELFPSTGRPNGKKTLIMELCTGGSLASALRKPENHYGLPESQFLLVWEHLTNAVQHLRDLKISHRDLKPGNILIYIRENGSRVYKLADFDTARELDDGESFPSLVGTVPYLNPQMYQRAVQKIPGENCSTSVDLWSIGVTLYETATGKLPFRPFNWNSPNGMHEILKGKPSGAISGVQPSPNGPILYATNFPTTCLSSVGLQTLLAPIVASLCESNEGQQWTYQKYFDESYNVLRRKRVHVLYFNTVQTLCVYLKLHPGPSVTKTVEPSYSDLLAGIQAQIKVPVDAQVLFYKNSPILSFLGKGESLRSIQTTEETPLILWNNKSEQISPDPIPTPRKFKQFGNVPEIYADANTAGHNMKSAYVQKRNLEQMSQKINLIHSAVSAINQSVVELLIQISKETNSASSLTTSLENHFEMTKTFVQLCESLLASVQTTQTQKSESYPEEILKRFKASLEEMEAERLGFLTEFQKLKVSMSKLTPSLDQLTNTRIQNRSLVVLWDDLIQPVTDINSVNEFLKTGSKLMSELELSFNILRPETKTDANLEPESISHAREYYRHIERLKMPATYQSFLNLVSAFQTLYESVLKKFAEWYSTAYFVSMQPGILRGHLTALQADFGSMDVKLTISTLPRFRDALDDFRRGLKDFMAEAELDSAAKDYSSKETQTETVLKPGPISSAHFQKHFQSLAATRLALQLELENNDAMLDESLLLLSSMVSKLTT